MKKLLFLLVLVFSLVAFLRAEDIKVNTTEKAKPEDTRIDFSKITFTTDKGSEVKVTNLVCGLLRNLEKGERKISCYTSSGKPVYSQSWSRPEVEWGQEIPVIDGYVFGAFIAFGAFPEGEKIPVEIIDTPPVPFEVDGKKQTAMRQTYYLTKVGKKYPLITTFKKEEPHFKHLGKWKKEFYNHGKLIFSYTYDLVRPTTEEIARNQVYEDYVEEAKKNQAVQAEAIKKDKTEAQEKPQTK